MNSQVELLPILDDNYVFIFRLGPDVCLVDPGDGERCADYLLKNNLELNKIFITHHHGDHIDGIPALKHRFPKAEIYAPLKNKHQIPDVDFFVQDQQIIQLPNDEMKVLELPGHTLGIVGYHNEKNNWLFSGDVLFGLGCGRLFEGTAEVAFASLAKIAKLKPVTSVFCTHEYTKANLQFVESLAAQQRLPKNFDFDFFETYKSRLSDLRDRNQPSVPLQLEDELRVNPFLLCILANDLALFTQLREARNNFRPK